MYALGDRSRDERSLRKDFNAIEGQLMDGLVDCGENVREGGREIGKQERRNGRAKSEERIEQCRDKGARLKKVFDGAVACRLGGAWLTTTFLLLPSSRPGGTRLG